MNYRQADPTKETSCKECIFAIYDGKTQTDCMHDRIKKYKDQVTPVYDDDKEYFVIERICTLKRPTSWNGGDPDINKARKEILTTFDILINIDNIDEQKYQHLKDTLNNINYLTEKYYIQCISSLDKDKNEYVLRIANELNMSVHVIHDNIALNNISSKYTGVYSIYIELDNIDMLTSCMKDFDQFINEDMKKIIICKYKDIYIVSNMALKITYKDLYLDYKNNIEELRNHADQYGMFLEIQHEKKEN